MINVFHSPLSVFAISFATLWASAWFGAGILRRRWGLQQDEREDFGVILGATPTLLALLIGFSFSMAINRYDQRKNLEEAEANAIGTEYFRADLLATPNAEKVRALLRAYARERILFYLASDRQQLQEINQRTVALQGQLWAATVDSAAAQPTPIVALAVSGMNDVINAQGFVQAAWWNRIPAEAWVLMLVIAAACNLLVGFNIRSVKSRSILRLMVFPLVIAISLYLIADIDSPRRGLIRVVPQNLSVLVDAIGKP
ncbi:MAG: hypothetical protein ABL878_03720 [Burkholderiales bacterium]